MKLLIHGRNLELTAALREYTETKLSRAVNHFNGMVQEADVHLSVARNPRVPQQTAEVTLFASGTVIRAQERSENLYASIDMVASKLTRQLKRHKDRRQGHHHGHAEPRPEPDTMAMQGDLLEGRSAELPAPVVRRKYFAMPAMSLEEAIHQLEVIDHDFYVFRGKDSNTLQVVYQRNHGGYGVIQARE
ncbi:MAG: ribosome-associated translation inhibitor RaiA [Synechococcus sp.]|nr:ribosome-associated translation inhibitor RaiA [Synechococcus sp.]